MGYRMPQGWTPPPGSTIGPTATLEETPKAVGRHRHTPGVMNKLEASYWGDLEFRKAAGEILWAAFEPMKFRIGEKCFFAPDFAVMLADRSMELIDTKGHCEDDAVVKLRAARTLYPMFVFRAIKREGGRWIEILKEGIP